MINTQAPVSMRDWVFNEVSREYALTSGWGEVLDQAHLSPKWLVAGIERFVAEREARLGRLKLAVQEAPG